MGGGLEIKSDDIGRLGLKARVLARHVATHGMGLQTGRAPGAGNGRVAGAKAAGEPARAPVSGAVAGWVAHGFENAGLGRGGLGIGFASAITRGQAGQSLGEEALLPGINRAVGASELAPDRAERVALGEQENDRGAARFAHRNGAAAEPPLQFSSFPWSQSDFGVVMPKSLTAILY